MRPTPTSAHSNARSARGAPRKSSRANAPTAVGNCFVAHGARPTSSPGTPHPRSASTNPKAAVTALAETALICRVPEAERYIAHYRQRFDPSARRNVPAHVTILYPFMAPESIDADVLETLSGVARSVPCFQYRLARTERFPVAMYLAP